MPDKKHKENRTFRVQGFTLLELIISLALLALIVTITLGAMRMGSRSIASGERRTEILERYRTVSALMDAQVQSQLPITQEQDGKKSYYFRGDSKTLRMVTGHSIWGGQRGYVIVDYRVESEDGGKETLWASEQTPGIEGKRETRLFTAASGISFAYFNREPADSEGKWTEEWSEETLIPSAIRLHVNDDVKENLLVFPVRSRGEMKRGPLALSSPKGGAN